MNATVIASSHQRLVLGLGETGRSVIRFWQAQGIPCIAVDDREALRDDDALSQTLAGVEHYFGALPLTVLQNVHEVIASPGIPAEHPVLVAARERDIAIRGDIDLFMESVEAPVVGITGSNGKSTVTALLGHLLAASGRKVAIGGNLGRPALDLLSEHADYYVLELSSFQLERAGSLGLSVAAVLNVTADHLDRHGSLVAYQQAKHRIFRGAGRVVVNLDDPLTAPLLAAGSEVIGWRLGEPDLGEFGIRDEGDAAWLSYGFQPFARRDALALAGRHNTANVLATFALAAALDISPESLISGLTSFVGLPHRCAVVEVIDGVRYVDDSKATNVASAVAAIQGLSVDGALILIVGGQSKGQDLSALYGPVKACCSGVVVIGEAVDELCTVLDGAAPLVVAHSMDDAVDQASQMAAPNGTVLLSPACASFDMFSGFAERGTAFVRAVSALAGGAA